MEKNDQSWQFHFFIIFGDVVEYFSLRFTQLKKQGSRTELILALLGVFCSSLLPRLVCGGTVIVFYGP